MQDYKRRSQQLNDLIKNVYQRTGKPSPDAQVEQMLEAVDSQLRQAQVR